MLVEALDLLSPDDVLVLDRGYPAAWLVALLGARVRHQAPIPSRFPIVRSMKSTTWRCAEKFR
jgi:hypothetical protein